MASSSPQKKKKSGGSPVTSRRSFHAADLADGLARQDMALVALALRNGPTVVPLIRPTRQGRPGEVWTYKDPNTGEVALLLFSDAKNKPANMPPGVGLHSPQWLREFLEMHEGTITTVFLDIAGPHPMQASPADLLAALTAEV